MKLPKLAIALTASVLLFGCSSQSPQPQTQSSPTPVENTPNPETPPLQAAVRELQLLQTKLKTGINATAYSSLIADTMPLVQRAKGDAKAVAAAKSAIEGHQLALKFWQCDRVDGYEELHQCRGKALSGIFAKYPDIAAQVKASVKSKDLPAISAGLDKDELLKRIWEKTSIDTDAASQEIAPNISPKQPKP